MTDKQYRSLARYTARIAKELGLSHMTLSLDTADPGGASDGTQAAASWEGVFGRHRGVIQVSREFDHFPPEHQRVYIVHELLHAHTEHVRALVRTSLAPVMGQQAFDVFMAGYTQADELATDALAEAIAPNYPLWEGK